MPKIYFVVLLQRTIGEFVVIAAPEHIHSPLVYPANDRIIAVSNTSCQEYFLSGWSEWVECWNVGDRRGNTCLSVIINATSVRSGTVHH